MNAPVLPTATPTPTANTGTVDARLHASAIANAGANSGGDSSNNPPGNSSGNSAGNSSNHPSADASANASAQAPNSTDVTGFSTPTTASPLAPAHSADLSAANLSANAGAPGLAFGVAAPQAGHAVTLAVQAQPAAMATPDLSAIATHIASKWNDGVHQFDIRLDPVELGRIDVRLSVGSDGQTNAQLSAERPQTLNLLQSDSGTLVRTLRDAGIDMSGNNLSFSLKSDNPQTSDRGKQGGDSRSRSLRIGAIDGASAQSTSISGLRWNAAGSAAGNIRVDIRV